MNSRDVARSETSRVTGVLREEIIDGVREPGSRLVERELAVDLGVSRVPVREALKQLAAEGLVSMRPNTWSTVRIFTASDIADFNEVRTSLEIMAFELAAHRHTRESLAELEEVVTRGQQSAAAGDATTARHAGAQFHALVTKMSGNQLLVEINRMLDGRLRWLLSQHDDLQHVADEHAELYQAIAYRDPARVRELALHHLDTSRQQQDAHSELSTPLTSATTSGLNAPADDEPEAAEA